MSRKPYAESLQEARSALGWEGSPAPEPRRRPRHDDDPYGPSLFKTEVADAALESLTLPGTFIGRSELRKVSLRNCDLHLATWCWNDFIDCDWSGSDLTDSDLRASVFSGCRFTNARLRGCDFRRSGFENCDFGGADLDGAVATRDQAASLNLSKEQSAKLRRTDDTGEEPAGG